MVSSNATQLLQTHVGRTRDTHQLLARKQQIKRGYMGKLPTQAVMNGNGSAPVPAPTGNGPLLILMRHGESLWNERNLFTGCVDVPLTDKGVEEALEAGRRIRDLPVDAIYVSDLMRAQMTAMIAMTQHLRGKVPVILHDDSDEASERSKIYSDEVADQTIPVVKAWELNERIYGALQGLNKKATAEKYGDEQVKIWRRSYDIPPPKGESLEMTAGRSVTYFKDKIVPHLETGENVLISAHGNSLRAIIMFLEDLSPEEVVLLELFTGIPLLYEFIDGKFYRRGTPLPKTQPGVFALSPGMAKYKSTLETLKPGYSS